ncbi:hypothetical protein [Clavibacter zhangzhiyongii]|uniref:hypothetical protein n=1 Tax=Clavibacter zhangzhiyongii TaxID=2768071 RepID=UPI0039E19929
MRNLTKSVFGLATAGFLVVGLAACSTPAETPSSSSAAPSASATTEANPTPLATIPTLTGVDTKVTLDSGFTGALTTLGLTPGVIGGATLDGATGTLAFPITGGNVKYFDPEMDYRPYVQGEIDHDGSGISLTAGDTVVKLTDFVIDPGTSRL